MEVPRVEHPEDPYGTNQQHIGSNQQQGNYWLDNAAADTTERPELSVYKQIR